jgi:exodeoxyribonuclease-3
MYSWNVNGFRACLKKGFQDFYDNHTWDIICLQETKLQPTTTPAQWLEKEDIHTYWNYSKEKKGYSGTAILSKKKPLQVHMDIGVEEHDIEGRVITLEYESFYLLTSYTPNSSRGLTRLDYRQQWDIDFIQYCQKLEQKKPLIICGDLNVSHQSIDLANPKSNYNKTAGYTQQEIDGFESLLRIGLLDTFREFEEAGGHYSWWSYRQNARQRNIGWRLDYFLTSQKLKSHLKKASICNQVMGSDHCPVYLEIDIP